MKNLNELSKENIEKMTAGKLIEHMKDYLSCCDFSLRAEEIKEAVIDYSMHMLKDTDGVDFEANNRIFILNETANFLKAVGKLDGKYTGKSTEDEDTIDRLKESVNRIERQMKIEMNIKNSLYSFLIENKLMDKYQRWYEVNGCGSIDWEKYAKGVLTSVQE